MGERYVRGNELQTTSTSPSRNDLRQAVDKAIITTAGSKKIVIVFSPFDTCGAQGVVLQVSRDCEPSAFESTGGIRITYLSQSVRLRRRFGHDCIDLEMYLNQLHKQSVLNAIRFEKGTCMPRRVTLTDRQKTRCCACQLHGFASTCKPVMKTWAYQAHEHAHDSLASPCNCVSCAIPAGCWLQAN